MRPFVGIVTVVTAAALAGCGSGKPTDTREPYLKTADEEQAAMFKAAGDFLTAFKADDLDRMMVLADLPFLLGPEKTPEKVEARGELVTRLRKARQEWPAAEELPTRVGHGTVLRADEADPADRAAVALYLTATGPDGWLLTGGDPVAPSRAKVLVRRTGALFRVVGLLY